METFPAWSPDGRTLYFCRGNAYYQGAALDSLRYDLCSIDFDPETGRFGDRVNCLYEASAKGKVYLSPVFRRMAVICCLRSRIMETFQSGIRRVIFICWNWPTERFMNFLL